MWTIDVNTGSQINRIGKNHYKKLSCLSKSKKVKTKFDITEKKKTAIISDDKLECYALKLSIRKYKSIYSDMSSSIMTGSC